MSITHNKIYWNIGTPSLINNGGNGLIYFYNHSFYQISDFTKEVLNYYTNLLIIQYKNQPKAVATIKVYINALIANNLALEVVNGFNFNTAIGVQLDILGKYIGMDRFYTGTFIEGVWFGFSDTSGSEPIDVTGFADTSDFLTKEGAFLSENDIISSGIPNKLNDDDYRTLLSLKIIQNNINFSTKNINDAIYNTFGTNIYMIDNLDMSITYYIDSSVKSVLVDAAISKNLLPHPMGILVNTVIA